MKKIIKIKDGTTIPANAKYLTSVIELDHENSYTEWRDTPGIMGIIPIFNTETQYKVTPRVVFHYYEVDFGELK